MLRFPTSLIILTALLQGIAFVVSDCGIDHYEPASTLSASQLRSLSHLKEGLTAIERDLKTLLSVRHVGRTLYGYISG
jgi:CRISPR/Cas system CMR-associated protein Cmr5 small subunit